MIENISEISLKNFIELLCGNYSVLQQGEECLSLDLKKKASDLIFEYRKIVNPSGVESYLMDREEDVKIKSRLLALRMCKALLSLGDVDFVIQSMKDMGYGNVASEKVGSMIDRYIAECRYMQKKHDDRLKNNQNSQPKNVRESYDTEIAFIMTYFKMNIDINIISAGIYANMVRQADNEIRRKLIRRR
ncbi:hypothetical protein [uncultured Phocaeicola sp.]|uniref:hypothetical protein n=1 Tax=uncultured Phocaeicola sp. TaxID=990718 RepID=UPI0025F5F191|nr:hypothetical protein [uncultured Phocaeicola sp.]